ncbi:hypothetical protein D3C83_107660 [compost metagenome]
MPLLGDLFDFGWKANRRNLALLERLRGDPAGTQRASRAVVAGWAAAALLLVVLIAVAAVSVIRVVFGAVGQVFGGIP